MKPAFDGGPPSPEPIIRGTFHFHSTYSHDGRTSLRETAKKLQIEGFAFVIMTEHFEDFDRPKFDAYLDEICEINKTGGIILIPGLEVNLEGIDTIKFPVNDYDSCTQFSCLAEGSGQRVQNVVAHPSKYSFRKIADHLKKFEIHGIELWNQQADGSLEPPLNFLKEFRQYARTRPYNYFFGCDLHDVNLRVTNILVLARPEHLNSEAILSAISSGEFSVANIKSGISFRNGPGGHDLDSWMGQFERRLFCKATAIRAIRRTLRACYKSLPKSMQRSMNDFKNVVRNRI